MTLSINDSTINLKTVTTQANSSDPLGNTRGQVKRILATVHPTQNTPVGTELVQFVIPFTRRECTSAAEIRVFAADGTTELPVFSKSVLDWHNWDQSPSQFIRSALVTAQVTIVDVNTPVNIYVEWGGGSPTVTLPVQPDELNWVDYRTSGLQWSMYGNIPADRRPQYDFQRDTYAGLGRENIMEPRTWVTLPKEYLRQSEIFTPFSEKGNLTNQDLKDVWDFYGKAMDTNSNENGTHVKEKSLCPYMFNSNEFARADVGNAGKSFESSGYAVWLADRGSVFAHRYVLTGELKDLIRAHRNTYYYNSVVQGGIFMPKMLGKPENDGKYLYGRPLICGHLLTGTTSQFVKFAEIEPNLNATVSPHYTTDTVGIWTEREASIQLNFYLSLWEYNGSDSARQAVIDMVDNLWSNQQTPRGGGAKDGSFRHYLGHHEGFGGQTLIGSPWMSVLLLGELVRYFEHSLDSRVMTMMYDLSQFVSNHALYLGNSIVEYVPDDLVPAYLASAEGYSSKNSYTDAEHAWDVLHIMARGRMAADFLGHDYSAELQQMKLLLRTAGNNVRYWTRDGQATINAGYPTTRNDPYRKLNWQYGSQNACLFKLLEDL